MSSSRQHSPASGLEWPGSMCSNLRRESNVSSLSSSLSHKLHRYCLLLLGRFLDEGEGEATVSGMPLIIRRHDM
ncbi:MAG TPA: hypothetical protein VE544_13475 [Nitrososphaeraceae archaeon]|nr:hypothetical protein [Nitrososphaeraceae archaeon]